MLRITAVPDGPSLLRLKLEGRIVSDWVALLEHECLKGLRTKQKVILDFSAVTFMDGRAIEMLKRIATEKLEIVNAALPVEELLRAGADQ